MRQPQTVKRLLLSLPDRSGSASANMATDQFLLDLAGMDKGMVLPLSSGERPYPAHGLQLADSVLFRHYTWEAPAATFGIFQPWRAAVERIARDFGTPDVGPAIAETQQATADVNAVSRAATIGIKGASQPLHAHQSPTGLTPDICRRPTGGGVVDHRQDWTYSLVIGHRHQWFRMKPSALYQLIHSTLADCLRSHGVPCELAPCNQAVGAAGEQQTCGNRGNARNRALAVCFDAPSPMDVVHSSRAASSSSPCGKIAGASMRRTRNGVLLQGSINFPGIQQWIPNQATLKNDFVERLAGLLEATVAQVEWPSEHAGMLEKLRKRHESEAWFMSR